ncbi:hypothetical protein C8J57DRAFT_1235473 [Mycena rebaudengoi]|nr:hypothetical protein C8J57DRAFT_1235473 [Mycena rebaudengoi]
MGKCEQWLKKPSEKVVLGNFSILLYTKEGKPEGFSDLMRYWTVEGSILAHLSQDFGSPDPHIWAIDGRLPILGGARDKLSFSSVGACLGNPDVENGSRPVGPMARSEFE